MWLNNDGNWENVPVDSLYGMGVYNQDFHLVEACSDPELSDHHAYTRSQVFDSDSQMTYRKEWLYVIQPNNVKSAGMITAGFYLLIKIKEDIKQEETIFTKNKEDITKEIIVNNDDIERSEFLKAFLKSIIQASNNLDPYSKGYIQEYYPDLL